MGTIVDVSEVILELGLSSSITEEERAVVQSAITKAEGVVKRFLGYDPSLQLRTEFYPRADLHQGIAQHVWEVNATNAYIRQLSDEHTGELQVQHIPIRSAPAMDLRVDYDGRSGTQAGSFAIETLKVEGQDFWPNYEMLDSDGNSLCNDGILRSVGLWPTTAGSVRMIYTAGYSDEELHGQDDVVDASPIVDAIIIEAKRRVEKMMVRKKSSMGWAAGPKSSESLGDYSYSIDSSLASKLYGDSKSLTDEAKMALEPFLNLGWRLLS